MLFVVLRKMFQNLWLSICLLLGFTLAVATVSSIPMFTRGAAFNEYTKSLRSYQIEKGSYPGGGLVNLTMTPKSSKNYAGKYMEIDKLVDEQLNKGLGLPILVSEHRIQADGRDLYLFKNGINYNSHLNFSSISELENHVNLLSGRMYSAERASGVIETVITTADMLEYKLALNKTYVVKGGKDPTQYYEDAKYRLEYKIKVVGIVEPKSNDDLYWFFNFIAKNEYPTFYMDQSLLVKEFFVQDPIIGVKADWYSAFDYTKLKIDDMGTVERVSKTWSDNLEKRVISDLVMPMQSMFDLYSKSVKILKSIMWLFNILILIILAFYILMISKLIIEFDKNEIALITSRGGGKLHILRGYLIQGLIIGILAFAAGPFLGMVVCKIIGASNSFLEFANRKAIVAAFNSQVYLYSALALLGFMAVMLTTSALFSNTTIIEYKQSKAREKNKYIYIRIAASVALLAFSIYWLYSYKSLAQRAGGSLVNEDSLPIDPLLFLNAALFIIGAGLFLTNLFPYLVRLVFQIGRKFWTPAVYTAFVQIARSAGQEQFLMLFIVLTLSIGVFSANSARTINVNATEKINYQTGADIAFKGVWGYQSDKNAPTEAEMKAAAMGDQQAAEKIQRYRMRDSMGLLVDKYIEPDFRQYTGLTGVESAAKVYIEESPKIISANLPKIKLLAVNSEEFGKTAWFRPQLLKYHWYEYLNLLADTPEGVLLSSSFKKGANIKAGDHVTLKVADKYQVEVVVLDFVDYWPSFTPKRAVAAGEDDNNYLVVANFGYIFNNVPLQPYEVWMKKKPGASSADIYNEMKDKGIASSKFTDADTLAAQMKKEPAMLGTNGSLTLGFILTMVISLNGFLIYWVMSLKRRSLQFGIMRAMGISSRNVVGMLTLEHIMTSGSAIIAGIAVGAAASRIFIPVYELFYNTGQQILPFRIITQRADYLKLYAVVAFMLLIALLILFVITKNVKVTQAVKLGED